MNKYEKIAKKYHDGDRGKLDASIDAALLVWTGDGFNADEFRNVAKALNEELRTVERLIYAGLFYTLLVGWDEELAEKAGNKLYRSHFSAVGEKFIRAKISKDEAINLVMQAVENSWKISELEKHLPSLERGGDWWGDTKAAANRINERVINAPRTDWNDAKIIRAARLFVGRVNQYELDKRK